ncbi:hypothetical protein JCM3770_001055, partial [Rhodotorula araucariae]
WVLSLGIESAFSPGPSRPRAQLTMSPLGVCTTDTFYTLAGISGAVALTTIPMYIFGKILRSWVDRHQKLFAL